METTSPNKICHVLNGINTRSYPERALTVTVCLGASVCDDSEYININTLFCQYFQLVALICYDWIRL